MPIGERIKRLREEAGLSQVNFAGKINVSKQTLYKYENNLITNIPSDKIEAIAKTVSVSPAYLMGWSDSEDGNERYKLYVDVEASDTEEAIFKAVQSILRKSGAEDKADTLTKEEALRLYNLSGFDSVQPMVKHPATHAAHFDDGEYTEAELDRIREFAAFVKSTRKPSAVPLSDHSYSEPKAERRRTDIDITDDMVRHNDDIMDDDGERN